MPLRLTRWTGLLVLPMLVGALLLMHGLHAGASGAHPSGTSVAASVVEEHAHVESTPSDQGHCASCLAGHVMAVCVAVIAAVSGIGLGWRLLARGGLVRLVVAPAARVRGVVVLARPPDPAWVRLSVMRC